MKGHRKMKQREEFDSENLRVSGNFMERERELLWHKTYMVSFPAFIEGDFSINFVF
jgi:hypothetical protein